MSDQLSDINSARLIVCEHKSHWTPLLRRLLTDDDIQVAQACGLVHAQEMLYESPESLLVIDLHVAPLSAIARMTEIVHGRFCRARVMLVGRHESQQAVWMLRELGAAHALGSPRELPLACRLIRRHFGSRGGLKQSIVDRLLDQITAAQ